MSSSGVRSGEEEGEEGAIIIGMDSRTMYRDRLRKKMEKGVLSVGGCGILPSEVGIGPAFRKFPVVLKSELR